MKFIIRVFNVTQIKKKDKFLLVQAFAKLSVLYFAQYLIPSAALSFCHPRAEAGDFTC